MKKILIVISGLYNGGAERVATLWANELSNKYDVTILTYKRFDIEYPVNKNVNVLAVFDNKDAKISKFKVLKKIRKVVKQNKIDIVIPFLPIASILTSLATLNLKVKVIHNIRCNPWLVPQKRIVRFARDWCVKKDKFLIVQNEEQLEYFHKFKKVKAIVIANPISSDIAKYEHQYANQLQEVISIGRLENQKNFPMLINAAEQLKKKNILLKFSIYGAGELKNNLEQLIKNKNLEDCVFLKGNTPNIFEVENKCDLFVMCSNFEGFPNALYEAMAMGMPVISTRCKTGPLSLISNDVNGVLVDVNDHVMLANKIEDIYNNPQKMAQFGKSAKKFIYENFDYEKTIGKLFDFIATL